MSTLTTRIGDLITVIGTDYKIIATALGNRLRVDAAQSLTTGQKAQGKANLDVVGSTEVGNPDVDLVALWTTAKS
jgi:hypothetical protein